MPPKPSKPHHAGHVVVVLYSAILPRPVNASAPCFFAVAGVDRSAPSWSFTSNPRREGERRLSAVILHRIDHEQNMHRYYRLDVQPDLFGEWALVREWGRIGQAGRYRVDPYPTAALAKERMQFQQAAKQGRGYARVR